MPDITVGGGNEFYGMALADETYGGPTEELIRVIRMGTDIEVLLGAHVWITRVAVERLLGPDFEGKSVGGRVLVW